MFKSSVLLKYVCVFVVSSTSLFSQENIGLIHDNYLPTQGIRLNPSAIVDQKPWLSIQLVGANAYGRNNLAYLNNTTLLGDLSNTQLNNSRQNYSGYLDVEVQGPAASIALGKFSIGLQTAVRGYGTVKRVPGELGEALTGETFEHVIDQSYSVKNTRAKMLAWGEVGLTFGGILKQKGHHMLTGGVSVNRLFGLASSNLIINNANVNVVGGEGTLNNLEGKYAFSENQGRGWSTSIGITYKKMKEDVTFYVPHSSLTGCRKPIYKYKVGVSLIDLGYINFNNDVQSASFNETITTDDAASTFSGDINDANVSNQKTSFTAMLPTALSGQFDYNVNDKVYLNASIIQKVYYPTLYGPERDNLLAVSARYESKWLGIGMPLSLQNYIHPQVGLALRLGPLNIGTDHIVPLIFKSDIYSADIYFSFKFNIMKSPNCRSKKIKPTKNKKGKLVYCPSWKM